MAAATLRHNLTNPPPKTFKKMAIEKKGENEKSIELYPSDPLRKGGACVSRAAYEGGFHLPLPPLPSKNIDLHIAS